MLVVLMTFASGLRAGEAETSGETKVTVQKGAVVIDRGDSSTRLIAGQEARVVNGAPAEVVGADPPTPPPALPIAVQWAPGQTVLMADGVGLLLRAGSGGSEGKSEDGRFVAKLSKEGELSVIDVKHERQAVRMADGRWLHRFAGCEMRVDAQGRTTVRLPDGHEIISPAPVADVPKPVAPAVPPAVPAGYRWQIGIHLDKTVDGLRVAKVSPGSPAEAAAFKPNDEVLAIGDLRSPTLEQIQERLKQAHPAQKIPFTVRREGRTLTLTVMMGAWE
jgi:hypothetical protein